MKNMAVGAQHVDGRNDNAPDGDDAGDLQWAETRRAVVILKSRDEDKDFTRKIC